MYKFILQQTIGDTKTETSITTNEEQLSELLPVMERLLRGAGFLFDGELNIEYPEEE